MIFGNVLLQCKILAMVNFRLKENTIQQKCPVFYNRKADYKDTRAVETLSVLNGIMKN